jgi:hypothetical protein
LRVVHFALLRGAMEAYGGTEVKNLGDGLMIGLPSLGSALGVRVGFGEPVVEAAPLCAKCDSGQAFTSIGDRELTGMPEPMTVDWEPVGVAGAVPSRCLVTAGEHEYGDVERRARGPLAETASS